MKTKRQAKILELIKKNNIETQEELSDYLEREGYQVTQATVSRDIRQLRLVKAATGDGHYRYTTSSAAQGAVGDRPSRFENIFGESVLSVDSAGHIVMVSCHSGMANAACEVFDLVKWGNVIGSLAGDNTFIILMRSEEAAKQIVVELRKYIR